MQTFVKIMFWKKNIYIYSIIVIRNGSCLHRKIARSNVEANGVTRGHTHTYTSIKRRKRKREEMMKRNRNFDRATVNTNSLEKHRLKRLGRGYRRLKRAQIIFRFEIMFTRNRRFAAILCGGFPTVSPVPAFFR